MMRVRRIVFVVSAVILAAAPVSQTAQAPYEVRIASGRDVAPAYEGWKRNPDGTFTMYFGYMNRNYEEELDIPVGPDNSVDPGGDRGQPTHFYPRRHSFLFTVVVPKDFGLERKVVWSLTVRGNTNTAKGWLQPEWEINDEIVMMNSGAGADLQNEPPRISGSGPHTITQPSAVTLTAMADDDGRPRPRTAAADPEAIGTGDGQGLSVRWIHYRGPGPVTLSPERAATGSRQPVTSSTTASFKTPGVYVLRAIASDGSLEAFHDVTITVK